MCGDSVPDLSPALSPSTLPPLPPTATSPVILLKPLHPLRDPKDGTFLSRPDHVAGRHVCVVLYATSNGRDERERAWRSRERDVSMIELGRAAKLIENAGFNWRELNDHENVFAAAEGLRAPGTTH